MLKELSFIDSRQARWHQLVLTGTHADERTHTQIIFSESNIMMAQISFEICRSSIPISGSQSDSEIIDSKYITQIIL